MKKEDLLLCRKIAEFSVQSVIFFFPNLKEGTQLKIVIKGKELEFSWDKNG